MRTTTRDTDRISIICRAIVYVTGLVIVGILVGLALFQRDSGFEIVLDKERQVVLRFDGNQTSLVELLDKALAEADSPEKRFSEIVLKSHRYYHVSDVRLVDALRGLRENEETRRFTSALRGLLYDLKGPFSRPHTFSGAGDARLLRAFQDLEPKDMDPEAVSPLLSELWRMSLDLQGIFRPRPVNAVVEAAPGVERARASACMGSILDGKVVMIVSGPAISAVVSADDWTCTPRTAQELLAGKPERLRLAPEDAAMLGNSGYAGGSASELEATIYVSPQHYRSLGVSPPQHASLQ